jgi:hypothetical protein
VCSRRNNPSEPLDDTFCDCARIMYSSLELSQAFLMLYDTRMRSSIGILSCCSWRGLSGCVNFFCLGMSL